MTTGKNSEAGRALNVEELKKAVQMVHDEEFESVKLEVKKIDDDQWEAIRDRVLKRPDKGRLTDCTELFKWLDQDKTGSLFIKHLTHFYNDQNRAGNISVVLHGSEALEELEKMARTYLGRIPSHEGLPYSRHGVRAERLPALPAIIDRYGVSHGSLDDEFCEHSGKS